MKKCHQWRYPGGYCDGPRMDAIYKNDVGHEALTDFYPSLVCFIAMTDVQAVI